MFKKFRIWVLKGIIKDIVNSLPSIKQRVLSSLKDEGDTLVEVIKDAIEKKLKEIFK